MNKEIRGFLSSFIDDFKEPQDFLIQEKLNLIQKYEVYEKKKKNFDNFALEMRKAMGWLHWFI